jgi:hypothetical protein
LEVIGLAAMLANAVDQLISISEERQQFNTHHCFKVSITIYWSSLFGVGSAVGYLFTS